MTTPNESETNGIGRRTALKKGLLVTTIAGVGVPAGFGGVATAGLGQGVVAHYQLNNLKGQGPDKTEVHDSSPNDNDGTAVGDVTPVDGKEENAFEFDGDGDYVQVEDDLSSHFSDEVTISAWVKTDVSGVYKAITALNDNPNSGSNSPPALLRQNADDEWELFVDTGNGTNRVSGGSVTTSTWTHVAGTYDGSNIKVFVDSFQEASATHSDGLDAPDEGLFIGAWQKNDGSIIQHWNGLIDDVYVYNRALDEEEICQLFMRGLSDELVAYYPLDEFADTTVVPDESENDNDGEAFGDPTVVGGLVDNAFAFDGDDYVSVPDVPLLDITQELTLAAWIKPPDTAQNGFARVISRETSGVGNRQYNVGFDSAGTNPRAIVDTTGTNSVEVVGTTDVTDDDWHHVAMTFDSNDSLTIYVDGESEDSTSVSSQLVSRTSPVTIGREAHGGAGVFYTGLIDEVRIYDRVLPESEIEGLHHCQSP